MKNLILLVLLSLMCSLIYSQAQIWHITEIDGVSLRGMNREWALHNNRFYFQLRDNNNLYVASDDKIVETHNFFDTYPDADTNDFWIWSRMYVNSDSITFVTQKLGIMQYDGTEWKNYLAGKEDFPARNHYGLGYDGKGKFVTRNRNSSLEYLVLENGNAKIETVVNNGEEVRYERLKKQIVYYNGDFYLSSEERNQEKKAIEFYLYKLDDSEFNKIDESIEVDDFEWLEYIEEFKVHEEKLWFVISGKDAENPGSNIEESRLVTYDGSNYVIIEPFFSIPTDKEYGWSIIDFEFDRYGKLWVLMGLTYGPGFSHCTLTRYNHDFELEYELDLRDYHMWWGIILTDKAPEGTDDIYVVSESEILILDANITSVEDNLAESSEVKITPNPVVSAAKIEYPSTKNSIASTQIKCIDYLGREVNIATSQISFNAAKNIGTANIDLGNAKRGYYFIIVSSGGKSISAPVFVE